MQAMQQPDPIAPARSYLFVPADRPDRLDKAWDSEADEVIVDLEDAVAPDRKAAAREALSAWLDPTRPVWVRVNAMDTPWFDEDIALASRPGVAGVVLPKAEVIPPSFEREGAPPVIALIETARGMRDAASIGLARCVVRLAFGSIDFQQDLGISGDGEELLFFRSQIVWQSRLASLPAPIDGVSTVLDDAAALAGETARSRRLGFGARLCIHPRQVAAVHQAFVPGEAECRWAERVCEAMEAGGQGAVSLDGRMVDRPVWLQARAILAQAAASGKAPARRAAQRS